MYICVMFDVVFPCCEVRTEQLWFVMFVSAASNLNHEYQTGHVWREISSFSAAIHQRPQQENRNRNVTGCFFCLFVLTLLLICDTSERTGHLVLKLLRAKARLTLMLRRHLWLKITISGHKGNSSSVLKLKTDFKNREVFLWPNETLERPSDGEPDGLCSVNPSATSIWFVWGFCFSFHSSNICLHSKLVWMEKPTESFYFPAVRQQPAGQQCQFTVWTHESTPLTI